MWITFPRERFEERKGFATFFPTPPDYAKKERKHRRGENIRKRDGKKKRRKIKKGGGCFSMMLSPIFPQSTSRTSRSISRLPERNSLQENAKKVGAKQARRGKRQEYIHVDAGRTGLGAVSQLLQASAFRSICSPPPPPPFSAASHSSLGPLYITPLRLSFPLSHPPFFPASTSSSLEPYSR